MHTASYGGTLCLSSTCGRVRSPTDGVLLFQPLYLFGHAVGDEPEYLGVFFSFFFLHVSTSAAFACSGPVISWVWRFFH